MSSLKLTHKSIFEMSKIELFYEMKLDYDYFNDFEIIELQKLLIDCIGVDKLAINNLLELANEQIFMIKQFLKERDDLLYVIEEKNEIIIKLYDIIDKKKH